MASHHTYWFLMLAAGWLLFVAVSPLTAGDWPQILGPTRSGVAQDETLASKWPTEGPAIIWRQNVGAGYAGVAIAKGQVIAFHRLGDTERVESFDLETGKSQWRADFEATYRGGVDPDTGPRCVPTVHDGKVYVFGAAGDMHCVDLRSGRKNWSRALAADYKAPEGYFGAGSSPIIASGKLWVNLGGKDAGLVALDPATGKTLHALSDAQASYSAPTLAKWDGRETLIFVTRLTCVGIDPASGRERFSFPFGQRGPTVNAATPLVLGDKLFVSASYGIGARLVDLSSGQPKALWENDSSMSSQYTTCVHHDGYLYGVDGREDVGVAKLRCIEAATGKVVWSEDDYGIAHIILAGDLLLIVRSGGQIELAPATPEGFKPLASARLIDGTFRALPALSQGKLVVRTVASGGRAEVLCVDVGR